MFNSELQQWVTIFEKHEDAKYAESLYHIGKSNVFKENNIHRFAQKQNYFYRVWHHEPTQHIIGYTYFLKVKVLTNKHVLAPRPETEELAFIVCKEIEMRSKLNRKQAFDLLDICTGSGCIPIAIKQYSKPIINCTAIELSAAALQVAQQNAMLNNTPIVFIQQDILHQYQTTAQQYDFITANPPYVTPIEFDKLDKNVKHFDPTMALLVPADNPLLFYKKIITIAEQQLKIGGKLYLEINQYLYNETMQLFTGKSFDAQIKKDMYGNWRFIIATRK